MELYQAEWCPYSHRIRARLTELGVDVTLRQVPADPGERDELETKTGTREIPVLVAENAEPISGTDAILDYLNGRYEERADVKQHRAKARVDVPSFFELRL